MNIPAIKQTEGNINSPTKRRRREYPTTHLMGEQYSGTGRVNDLQALEKLQTRKLTAYLGWRIQDPELLIRRSKYQSPLGVGIYNFQVAEEQICRQNLPPLKLPFLSYKFPGSNQEVVLHARLAVRRTTEFKVSLVYR